MTPDVIAIESDEELPDLPALISSPTIQARLKQATFLIDWVQAYKSTASFRSTLISAQRHGYERIP